MLEQGLGRLIGAGGKPVVALVKRLVQKLNGELGIVFYGKLNTASTSRWRGFPGFHRSSRTRHASRLADISPVSGYLFLRRVERRLVGPNGSSVDRNAEVVRKVGPARDVGSPTFLAPARAN